MYTDGITCNIKGENEEHLKQRTQLYYDIINQWCKDNTFTGEYAIYNQYHRRDINNYVCLTNEGKIKTKGIFNTEIDYSKGYEYPVIKYCLRDYYLSDIKDKYNKENILEFAEKYLKEYHLKDPKAIYKFCKAQKIGKQFQMYYNGEKVQNTCRWFVSLIGGDLYKIKKFTNNKGIEIESKSAIEKNRKIMLFNDFYNVKFENYQIDYDFYIEKIVENIIGKQKKIKNKNQTILL